jgi:hypothetical protein
MSRRSTVTYGIRAARVCASSSGRDRLRVLGRNRLQRSPRRATSRRRSSSIKARSRRSTWRRALTPPFSIMNPVALMNENTKFDILRRMDAAARPEPEGRVGAHRLSDEVGHPHRDVRRHLRDRPPVPRLHSCTATAARNGTDRRTDGARLGGRVGEDYFLRRDPEAVAREAAQQAMTLLGADPARRAPCRS